MIDRAADELWFFSEIDDLAGRRSAARAIAGCLRPAGQSRRMIVPQRFRPVIERHGELCDPIRQFQGLLGSVLYAGHIEHELVVSLLVYA